MDIQEALRQLNGELDATWSFERRLEGGWQSGASVVVDVSGNRAVLKMRAFEPDWLVSAMTTVNEARRSGWPAPEWYAAGLLSSGEAWVLQEHVIGSRPERLSAVVAVQMTEILDVQAGLGALATLDMSAWAHGVVFEDWDGLRAQVLAGFPGGHLIVQAVDDIAGVCSSEPLPNDDLVHANFEIGNTLLDGSKLWVVDVDGVGRGTRAYDAAEALIVAAGLRQAEPAGMTQLWRYADGALDPRELAVCAGSIALSMASAFIRLGHVDEAPAALPGMCEFVAACLERAR